MSVFLLPTIQARINYYSYPVLLTVGCIGNVFNLILFNRQRHNACSIYLINSSLTNLLYLINNGFFRMFPVPYNDGSMRAFVVCKLSSYLPGFLGQVTKTILILACIDRYLITSDRATLRVFSTPKRAKYLIFFTYIFWLIAASHSVILPTISNGQCTRLGIYATLFSLYVVLFVGLIPSAILSIFACLTFRNMKQLRNRIQPSNQGSRQTNHTIQRRDRDLLVLVIAEVIVYIITTAPFSMIQLEIMISQYVLGTKSVYHSLPELFALNIALLLLYILSAAPFYIYMSSSASFRRDFRHLIVFLYRKLRRQPVEPSTHRTNQTITQRDTRV